MANEWPTSTDYFEAVQNPGFSFADSELQSAEVATDHLGLPRPCTGNFADVYQFTSLSGRSWAVKCFTRKVPHLDERYAAISQHLQRAGLSFTVTFQYLEKGIRVHGEWFPILKMDWVEGLTLNEFVRKNIQNKRMIDGLFQIWLKAEPLLRRANVTHGDLQHGNILLVPGAKKGSVSLKLIDYDGMWIPALAQHRSGEIGHPAFQHPERARNSTYTADVDRFPHLVISTALRCLTSSQGAELWERYDNGDNLLFTRDDIEHPEASKIVNELWGSSDAQMRAWAGRIVLASQSPLNETPLLSELMKNGTIPLLSAEEKGEVEGILSRTVSMESPEPDSSSWPPSWKKSTVSPANPALTSSGNSGQVPMPPVTPDPTPGRMFGKVELAGAAIVAALSLAVGIFLGIKLGAEQPAAIADLKPAEEATSSGPVAPKMEPKIATRFESPEIAPVEPVPTTPEPAPVAIRGDGVLRTLKFSGGKDEYVVLKGATEKFDLNHDFTIEMWAKFADPIIKRAQFLAGNQSRNGYEFIRDGARDEGWALEMSMRGLPTLEFRAADQNGNWFKLSRELELTEDWTHLAVIRKGHYFAIYANGLRILQATRHPSEPPLVTGTRDVYLGGTKGTIPENKQFTGELQGFQIASTARYLENFLPPASLKADEHSIALLNFRSGPRPFVGNQKDPTIWGELVKVKWVDAAFPTAVETTPVVPRSPVTDKENRPVFQFREGRADQHVAEYFFELPPIPKTQVEADVADPLVARLPHIQDVTRISLRGLRDLNRWLANTTGEFRGNQFVTWLNLPKNQLEVYLASEAREGLMPKGHLLAVFAGHNGNVTFRWKFVDNEILRRHWQPLLSHCILQFRTEESPSQGIALHRLPNRIEPITIKPHGLGGDQYAYLPTLDFPTPFDDPKTSFPFVLGSGSLTWNGEDKIGFGIETEREIRRTRQIADMSERYGGLRLIFILLDDGKIRAEIDPTKAILERTLSQNTQGLEGKLNRLTRLYDNYTKAESDARRIAAISLIAKELNININSKDQIGIVIKVTKARLENLSTEIENFSKIFRTDLADIEAAQKKEIPVSVVIYRIVDGNIDDLKSTTVVGECWLDPVLVIGDPFEVDLE